MGLGEEGEGEDESEGGIRCEYCYPAVWAFLGIDARDSWYPTGNALGSLLGCQICVAS